MLLCDNGGLIFEPGKSCSGVVAIKAFEVSRLSLKRCVYCCDLVSQKGYATNASCVDYCSKGGCRAVNQTLRLAIVWFNKKI